MFATVCYKIYLSENVLYQYIFLGIFVAYFHKYTIYMNIISKAFKVYFSLQKIHSHVKLDFCSCEVCTWSVIVEYCTM